MAAIAVYVTLAVLLAVFYIAMKGFSGYLIMSMAALAVGLVVGGLAAMEAK